MLLLPSALSQHAALVHAIAEVVIALALLFGIAEAATSRKRGGNKRREAPAPSKPSTPAPEPEQKLSAPAPEPEQTPDEERQDRDSSPEVPQVYLLCQDDLAADEATSPYAHILVSARGDTDAGKKRPRNEDSFLLSPDHSLFVVADGMGGHRGGKVASSLAVDTLKQAFDQTSFDAEFQSDAPIPRSGRELAVALMKANRAVFQAAQSEPELAEMGTTMVAARFAADERRVYVGHVGDSRCYRFRSSRLSLLTTDHTMRHLGLEGPHANELFRAVGIEQNVGIDLIVDMPRPDDIYLLCSDGLPKMVSDERIEEALCSEPDLESAVYRLIELANDAGGRDNVTVILVRVREQPSREIDHASNGTGKGASAARNQQLSRNANQTHARAASVER